MFFFLTQYGICLSLFLFLHYVLTFLLKFYNFISIRYRLLENIIMLSSLADGFSIKPHENCHWYTRCWAWQRKTFQRLDDPRNYSSKNCWKTQKTFVNKSPEFTPQIFETMQLSSSISIQKCQYKKTEPENFTIFPSIYLHYTKVSTANFSRDNNHVTLSFMAQLSGPTPKTIVRTTFHR